MPAKKKEVEEVAAEVATPKASKNEAIVTWAGNRTRVYTRKLHGDDFAAYAKEFATKNNGVVS